jgi:hypothetical protein
MSAPQDVDAVVVSDDDGVVDGVEEDEAKMLDTVSSTGKILRGGSERMERQWHRACNDPRFYQILGENFRFYFACVD